MSKILSAEETWADRDFQTLVKAIATYPDIGKFVDRNLVLVALDVKNASNREALVSLGLKESELVGYALSMSTGSVGAMAVPLNTVMSYLREAYPAFSEGITGAEAALKNAAANSRLGVLMLWESKDFGGQLTVFTIGGLNEQVKDN